MECETGKEILHILPPYDKAKFCNYGGNDYDKSTCKTGIVTSWSSHPESYMLMLHIDPKGYDYNADTCNDTNAAFITFLIKDPSILPYGEIAKDLYQTNVKFVSPHFQTVFTHCESTTTVFFTE
ncbi:hypothetical protein MAR_010350 [Mya arenaria]|uniref:Uncharacterized protein n=1 Tax=Mya arenaria TaxID=6604 RepID=A0ABY7E4R7_MYAAR|nr:hypothetical protein MAR_010350 [Mya arenaria]